MLDASRVFRSSVRSWRGSAATARAITAVARTRQDPPADQAGGAASCRCLLLPHGSGQRQTVLGWQLARCFSFRRPSRLDCAAGESLPQLQWLGYFRDWLEARPCAFYRRIAKATPDVFAARNIDHCRAVAGAGNTLNSPVCRSLTACAGADGR